MREIESTYFTIFRQIYVISFMKLVPGTIHVNADYSPYPENIICECKCFTLYPMIVMVPLISYYQLYLPCGRKRVFEEGYGRMFAERPTGSRASRQSASSGQSILGQMTQSHPSTKSHHQKTPNPYLRRPCRSLPRLIASR